MTDYQIRTIIAIVSFTVGLVVGYILWHRSKDSRTLTALQIVSIAIFFGYLGITSWGDAPYSDLVAVSILALTGGEPVGKVIARYFEERKK